MRAGTLCPDSPVLFSFRTRKMSGNCVLQGALEQGLRELRAEQLPRARRVVRLHAPDALAGDILLEGLRPARGEDRGGIESLLAVDLRVRVDRHRRDHGELAEEGGDVRRGAVADDPRDPHIARVAGAHVRCREGSVPSLREPREEQRRAGHRGLGVLLEEAVHRAGDVQQHAPLGHGDHVGLQVRRVGVAEAHVVGQHADRPLARVSEHVRPVQAPVDARDVLTGRAAARRAAPWSRGRTRTATCSPCRAAGGRTPGP